MRNGTDAVRIVGAMCLALSVTLGACDDETSNPMQPETQRFSAVLQPMNETLVDPVGGQAVFSITGGTLEATVQASGAAADMLHPQHVHAAGRCPPPSADTNGDGYIDVVEGLPFYGAILIPLDGDLSAQSAGSPGGFPTASSDGEIMYQQSTDLDAMITDLKAEDPNPDDPVIKLDGDLSLPTRTVVLHGVPPSTDLPESVKSVAGLPAHLTLPVACGSVRVGS